MSPTATIVNLNITKLLTKDLQKQENPTIDILNL